jgi:hypothetical protein
MYADLERERTYWVLKEMRRRCSDRAQPGDYERYFLRGITVCDRWQGRDGFANFLADMGERPFLGAEIDRIDNDLGYDPENCRWVDHATQTANRRYWANGQYECLTDAGWMRAAYVDDQMSISALAIEIGCHWQTVKRWLVKHELHPRPVKRKLIRINGRTHGPVGT